MKTPRRRRDNPRHAKDDEKETLWGDPAAIERWTDWSPDTVIVKKWIPPTPPEEDGDGEA